MLHVFAFALFACIETALIYGKHAALTDAQYFKITYSTFFSLNVSIFHFSFLLDVSIVIFQF